VAKVPLTAYPFKPGGLKWPKVSLGVTLQKGTVPPARRAERGGRRTRTQRRQGRRGARLQWLWWTVLLAAATGVG
jgi:hypothetical protein